MRHSHRFLARGLAIAVGLLVSLTSAPVRGAAADSLPTSITDREFWAMTEAMSEPGGSFVSDNMTSNETTLSTVAAALAQRVKPGGVYLGVGPEQNLTYIAAIRPKIAFITDIRRGNLHMQLLYKAVLELATDRADFLSLLFTKKRPAGLSSSSSASDLINAYWPVYSSDDTVYQANLAKITNHLTKTHGLPLSGEDLAGIAYVYHAFYWHGLLLNYGSRSAGEVRSGGVNYATLMMTIDSASGQERSFLASEENFTFLKALESKNLVVPVVGDFAGPKALRALGAYLKNRDAVVTAFYLSNVEDYLTRAGTWPAFCANVATMPLDGMSSFIRPGGMGNVFANVTSTTVAGANGMSYVQLSMRSGTNTAVPVATVVNGRQVFSLMELVGRTPFGQMTTEVAGCVGK